MIVFSHSLIICRNVLTSGWQDFDFISIPGGLHLRKELLSVAAKTILAVLGQGVLSCHGWRSLKAIQVFTGSGRIRKTHETIFTIVQACHNELASTVLLTDDNFLRSRCVDCNQALTLLREHRTEMDKEAVQIGRQVMSGVLQKRLPGTLCAHETHRV